MQVQDVLARLLRGETLSAEASDAAFDLLLGGGMDPAQIGSLLSLIEARGATVEELVGAARAMRRHVMRVPFPCGPARQGTDDPLIDTCGTGGAQKTFNVSTAAAIVAAAVEPEPDGRRVRVAKHGNRSRTGRGSAEVLAALGVNVDASPAVQARCLERVGVCFCFAIHHHPAMKHAAGARRALGFPTIFNLLGPLTNPAGARRQIIGVYEPAAVEKVARALAALGAERAMVVHGLDGLDEISTVGTTLIAHVQDGRVRTEHVEPGHFGLTRRHIDDLRAPDLESAVRTFRSVIDGEPGPAREMVELNAAAALVVAGLASSIEEGLRAASAAIDAGRAAATLEALARTSNEPASS